MASKANAKRGKAMTEELRSPLAIARDDWFASAEGDRATAGMTSGQYLRNRLELAFIAGFSAAENLAAGRLGTGRKAGKR